MTDSNSHTKLRVILLVVAVVVGLAVAAVPLALSVFSSGTPDSANTESVPGSGSGVGPVGSEPGVGGSQDDPDDEPVAAQQISIKHPRQCPEPNAKAQLDPSSELKGINLPCLTDGKKERRDHNLGESLAGKPTVINVWAWWCEPCRRELPIFDKLAKTHPEWNVVGVHLDRKEQAGADFLDDLGVTTMPTYGDTGHTFDAATGIPNVVPITLIYNADGTRAKMYPQTFRDLTELEGRVKEALQ